MNPAATLDIINGNLAIKTPYYYESDILSKDIIKLCADFAKWHKQSGTWFISANLHTLSKLDSRFKITMSSTAKTLLDSILKEKKARDYIEGIKNSDWRLDGDLSYFYRHQCVGLEAAKVFPQFAEFFDTGTGKTPLAIEIIRHYRVKTLVVCPIAIIEPAWMHDIRKFGNGLKAVSLWAGNKKKRLEKMLENADVYIINFKGYQILLKELLAFGIEMIIVDESSRMKNHKAQITKDLLNNAHHFKYRYILSGSPWPNSLLEAWGQMNFIDPNILGNNYYHYRGKYFANYDRMGYNWQLKQGSREKIMERIKTKAIFFSKDDCLDLPPKVYQVREIEMTSEQRRAYKDMKEELYLEIMSKEITVQNALAKMAKLRQITSGFVYTPDGYTIEISNAKYNELENHLEEIGNHQVTIWINYRAEAKEIKRRLGDKAVEYHGGITKQADKDSNFRKFTAGDAQYFIANGQSCAHGLTMTNATYSDIFSNSLSFEIRKQLEERQHRIGQTKSVTYTDFVVLDSIDVYLMMLWQGKKVTMNDALAYLK